MAEIAEGQWAGNTVRDAIRNMQAAVATVAAVTAAT
jgi:hypothetical protein